MDGNVVLSVRIKRGSRMVIGDRQVVEFFIDRHFNWFQKLMIGLCFGVKVEDWED